MFDVAIIGCGVVGAATAYSLSKMDLSVLVLESKNDVACGATKANSAVLHAGFDPKPGTMMAKLNVEGTKLAKDICRKLDVECEIIGSLVLAFNSEEDQQVNELYRRGIQNQVPELKLLSPEDVKHMEPHVSDRVTSALFAPTAAIISPWEYALAMAETAVLNGAELHLSSPVISIDCRPNNFIIHTPAGCYASKYIINTAGVHADEISAMIGDYSFSISGGKGEYYLLDKAEGTRVSHVIFQCPSKSGKGILVSPTVHGNLIVGPTAELTDKEDLSNTDKGLSKVRNESLKSIPDLSFKENIRTFAGVRANSTEDDFIIRFSEQNNHFLQVAGIKSPGLSSAAAIGEYVVQMLRDSGLMCSLKKEYVDERHRIKFRKLSSEQKKALIRSNPQYGHIICRCETITEGEIVEAIHRPISPTSINAVKRRCNAGMGRCQGGFCGPRVHEILHRELGIPMEKILLEDLGSELLIGKTKDGEINDL